MKALIRLGFLALIGLGLASQALRASRSEDVVDPQAALIDRLGRLHIHAEPIPDSRLLMARAPACGQPFVVGPLRSDGGENELTRRLTDPDVVVRYAYLGAVDARPSATKQFAQWGWATLLFSVGLRPTRPPADFILVAYPRSCVALGANDWSVLSP